MPVPTEIMSESPAGRRSMGVPGEASLAPFDAAALRFVACASSVVLLVCLLILPGGPAESFETVSWVLAFAVALPGGFAIASRQDALLARTVPAAAARALAASLGLLALALLLLRVGAADRLHHGLLAVAAVGALAAPVAVVRWWPEAGDRAAIAARGVSVGSLLVIVLLFLPVGALRPGALIPAVALAVPALWLLRWSWRWSAPPWLRLAADVVLCGVITLLVIQLPDVQADPGELGYHQGFFLGPANDVLHGRPMLGGAWSQYGVGVIDALALLFTVVPIGFGTLSLAIAAMTAGQYVCVYATLRLAGLNQALVVGAIGVSVAGNLFWPLNTYITYPSTSALRFGLPYLMILCAVAAARFPQRRRPLRVAVLVLLAAGAAWSFETFAYCGATYAALLLVDALTAGKQVLRRILNGLALGFGSSAAALLLLSLLTLVFDSHLDWRPYFEYLRLYSSGGFSQLPIEFFSPGPIMAAIIFFSGVGLLYVTLYRTLLLAPPLRTALAGVTGFAIVSFTYYLGRSHPNNLLVLLVPVVMLTALWVGALAAMPPARWRLATIATIVLAWAMIVVAGWPSVVNKWTYTAIAAAVPGDRYPLRARVAALANNPVFSTMAPEGAALLDAHLPPGAPALVLVDTDLTTEILIRDDRANLLPISHPPEDILIRSSWKRVRAAAEEIPAGTILLTSSVPPPPGLVSPAGMRLHYNDLQRVALSVLHRRFLFQPVQKTSTGLELVRLLPQMPGR